MSGWLGTLAFIDPAKLFHNPYPILFEGTLFEVNSVVTTEWGIMLLVIGLAYLATRRVSKVPTGAQNLFEALFDFLEGWLANFMGDRKTARKYLPLLGTFFLFILIGNYSGILPGAGILKGLFAPTARWGTTIALGLIVVVAVHYVMIKKHGFGGMIHYYLGPSPGALSLIMTPLTLLEHLLIQPFSLSLRLFGNMFAKEILLASVLAMVAFIAPIPIYFLGLLFGLIQAVVFTTLASIYISGADHGAH